MMRYRRYSQKLMVPRVARNSYITNLILSDVFRTELGKEEAKIINT